MLQTGSEIELSAHASVRSMKGIRLDAIFDTPQVAPNQAYDILHVLNGRVACLEHLRSSGVDETTMKSDLRRMHHTHPHPVRFARPCQVSKLDDCGARRPSRVFLIATEPANTAAPPSKQYMILFNLDKSRFLGYFEPRYRRVARKGDLIYQPRCSCLLTVANNAVKMVAPTVTCPSSD